MEGNEKWKQKKFISWSEKNSKIKYKSGNASILKVNDSCFVKLNDHINEKEILEKFLQASKAGFVDQNKTDNNKMITDDHNRIGITKVRNDFFEMKIGGSQFGCRYEGLYSEKVIINNEKISLIIFNKYVWTDGRDTISYDSCNEFMYYLNDTTFATFSSKVEQKISNQQIETFCSALDKGYVAKRQCCKGVKPIENANEIKINADLRVLSENNLVNSQRKILIVFSKIGTHKSISTIVNQKSKVHK